MKATPAYRRPLVAIAVTAVLLSLAACSSKTNVGAGLGSGKAGNAGQQALNNLEATSTATAVATAFAAPTATNQTVVVKTQQATTSHGNTSRQQSRTTVVTTQQAAVTRTGTSTRQTGAARASAQATGAAALKPFEIDIHADSSANPLDPAQAAVYVGQQVVWVNKDTVNRSVLAQDGEFNSPPIPPGGSFTYVPTDAGTISYQDGTRPYVDGQLQAVNPK